MKFAGLFVVLLLLFIASVPVWNSAVGAAVTTAAQDPSAVEASLGLDRPARRLIQQGLRTEGFGPGAPDGLFGPRTRTAIREWQEARGVPPTGYLDSVDVDLLRAAASLSGSSSPMPATATDTNVSPMITERPASLAEIPVAAPATTPVGHPAATSTRGNPQLPPAILVDRHLVRVERLLADDDYDAAHDEMLEIIALQKLHALVLPDDFQFEYARVAFRTGLTEVAIASLNEYLVAAGRGGAFYREALNLLDSPEETLRRVAAERRRIDAERRRIDAERRRVAPLQRAHNAMVQRQLEAAAVSIPRDTLKSGGVGPELVMMAPARFQYFAYDISAADHLHWVDIARPFAISKYEVTRAAFGRFVSRTRYQTDADRDPPSEEPEVPALSPAEVEEALGLDRRTRGVLQEVLVAEGYDVGETDGLFGPRTRAVIEEWQAARGDVPTGYLTGEGVEALKAVLVETLVAAGADPEVRDEYGKHAPSP